MMTPLQPHTRPQVSTTRRRELSEATIERLSDLWCEVLLADLRRRPITTSMKQSA
jgi:hypothetical protein